METPQKENTGVQDAWADKSVGLDDMPIIGTSKVPGGVIDPITSETKPEVKPEDTSNTGEQVKEPKPENGKGQPQTKEGEGDSSVFTATNGRKYKNVDELGNAFNESSKEGIRLSTQYNELKSNYTSSNDQLTEAQKTILSLQEFVGEGGYPDTKSAEEISEMTEEDKHRYFTGKEKWTDKVETFKTKLKNAKTETEAYNKQLSETIRENETTMTKDTNQFPDFVQLKPLRDKILGETSWLNNRVESPYISYLCAYALAEIKAKELATKASDDSRQAAANKAGGEAMQTAVKSGTGVNNNKAPTALDKELGDIVDVYKTRQSSF